jgi:DNA modification methylase
MSVKHRVIFGDARRLDEVADRSIDLIVTSPPYWQLKDYGHDGQLGFSDSYETYVNHLNVVWNNCHRVLQPGCRLCVNIGDQFARSAFYGRYKVIPIRTEIIRFCETVGFDYMGAIIWQKVTTTNTTGGGSVMGSYPYPRNGVVKLDYEFILLFRKTGKAPVVSAHRKERSKLSNTEWNTYFNGHWNFPGERQQQHLAMFPEELPRRLIKMFSFVGDTVLDPFLGSGTTSLAAHRLQRNSIGYEINPDFEPVIKSKLGVDEIDVDGVEYERSRSRDADETLLEGLPYLFHDPVRVDLKVDPRSSRFGSKIGGGESRPEELFSVEQVIAPNELLLSSGQRVRLLGVKPIKRHSRRAVEQLLSIVGGKRVYLRMDKEQEEDGTVLAYVYLRNRTPVNRHLIRSGLVAVDTSRDYRFKKAFLDERAERRK